MQYPRLTAPAATRRTTTTFRGYRHTQPTPEDSFYHMENMTSDHYPALSCRKRRSIFLKGASPQGMIAKDTLCYAEGGQFYIDGRAVEGLTLHTACAGCPRKDICAGYAPGKNRCQKQMVSMGAYVVILPDKVWVQTVRSDGSYPHGSLENTFSSGGKEVTVALCKPDGGDYGEIPAIKPASPADGALWLDETGLWQWSESAGAWLAVESTYVKITCQGIGAGFSQYDGVTLSGFAGSDAGSLEGTAVIWQVEENSIVVPGLVKGAVKTDQEIILRRGVPEMDYITVCGNRLWGCRYGKNAGGDFVNEIYCSKLGDFKNFQCFMGISTDSGVFSLGSDGPFTGAITYLDNPLFFKENMLHKIYVSETGAHSISHTPCRGVRKDCGKSLAIVGETLFYKARTGICAYDGSLPEEISQDLGTEIYGKAVAGAYGSKYYICMEKAGESHLFVYDTGKNMFHREDSLPVEEFCPCGEELYAMAGDQIVGLLGTGEEKEEQVCWAAETGFMGIAAPDSKYLSRLTVRMSLASGATASFYVRYDFSPRWEHIATVTGKELGSVTVPICPKRCDTVALRIEGQGEGKIYALTKTVEQGSDLP